MRIIDALIFWKSYLELYQIQTRQHSQELALEYMCSARNINFTSHFYESTCMSNGGSKQAVSSEIAELRWLLTEEFWSSKQQQPPPPPTLPLPPPQRRQAQQQQQSHEKEEEEKADLVQGKGSLPQILLHINQGESCQIPRADTVQVEQPQPRIRWTNCRGRSAIQQLLVLDFQEVLHNTKRSLEDSSNS